MECSDSGRKQTFSKKTRMRRSSRLKKLTDQIEEGSASEGFRVRGPQKGPPGLREPTVWRREAADKGPREPRRSKASKGALGGRLALHTRFGVRRLNSACIQG